SVAHALAHARQKLRKRGRERRARLRRNGRVRARQFINDLRDESLRDLVCVNQRLDRLLVVALRRVNQQRDAVSRTLLEAAPPGIRDDEHDEDGGDRRERGDGDVAPQATEAALPLLPRLLL